MSDHQISAVSLGESEFLSLVLSVVYYKLKPHVACTLSVKVAAVLKMKVQTGPSW